LLPLLRFKLFSQSAFIAGNRLIERYYYHRLYYTNILVKRSRKNYVFLKKIKKNNQSYKRIAGEYEMFPHYFWYKQNSSNYLTLHSAGLFHFKPKGVIL